MPLTMRFSSSFDRFSLRSTFADLPGAEQRRLPRPVAQLPQGALRVGARAADADAWLPWETTNFAQFVEQLAAQHSVDVLSFEQYFRLVFGRAPPRVLYIAQGAQFTATRKVRTQPTPSSLPPPLGGLGHQAPVQWS